MRGRFRWWLGVVALTAALIAGAFWAGTKFTTSAGYARRTQSASPTVLTTPVLYKMLSSTLTATGAVEADRSYEIDFGSVSVPGALPIVTAPGPTAGEVVASGSVIAQIAGQPVFAFPGTTPMYRDITLGDSGSDVLQLQDDLDALGFVSQGSAGFFNASMEAAVRAFYDHTGYTPITASSPDPGPSGAKAPPPLIEIPQADIVFVPSLPARVESASEAIGKQPGTPGIVLATGSLRAAIQLTTAQAALVMTGQPARLFITAPSGQTRAVYGTVTSVRPPAAAAAEGAATVAFVKPRRPLSATFIGAHVTAEVTVSSSKKPVLAVPVAALYSLPNGDTAVSVVEGHHTRAVNVDAGIPIGGYVAIRVVQGSLAPGAQVVVGE